VRNKVLETIVGLFMILGFFGLIFLAFKVSGLTTASQGQTYEISADFDDIGSLKVRAPVQVSGVTIGRVASIGLDPQSFRAHVVLRIDKKYNNLPIDSSASIYTQGILGSNYIALGPGFETENLGQGGHIETTHSALILENLIGQLLYSFKSGSNTNTTAAPAPNTAPAK
jgi:phospholipid/cholesterol/gamma-HCH transport system substrate-binding protein